MYDLAGNQDIAVGLLRVQIDSRDVHACGHGAESNLIAHVLACELAARVFGCWQMQHFDHGGCVAFALHLPPNLGWNKRQLFEHRLSDVHLL